MEEKDPKVHYSEVLDANDELTDLTEYTNMYGETIKAGDMIHIPGNKYFAPHEIKRILLRKRHEKEEIVVILVSQDPLGLAGRGLHLGFNMKKCEV